MEVTDVVTAVLGSVSSMQQQSMVPPQAVMADTVRAVVLGMDLTDDKRDKQRGHPGQC
jgi:hypothetical protein